MLFSVYYVWVFWLTGMMVEENTKRLLVNVITSNVRWETSSSTLNVHNDDYTILRTVLHTCKHRMTRYHFEGCGFQPTLYTHTRTHTHTWCIIFHRDILHTM